VAGAVTQTVKIGTTAIPAFWRENDSGLSRFSLSELREILSREASLFLSNDFGFRDLALHEILKYQKLHMAEHSRELVKHIDPSRVYPLGQTRDPGPAFKHKDKDSGVSRELIHVLNAVSPSFTGTLPFDPWILKLYRAGEGWKSVIGNS
jgi:hypothetical protein